MFIDLTKYPNLTSSKYLPLMRNWFAITSPKTSLKSHRCDRQTRP